MPTTTATINITNDIASSSISTSASMTLLKAGSSTLGMDTMTSVSKILSSTDQVDLLGFGTAGSTGSTGHNFLYINNPSSNPAEFFTLALGDDPQGSSADSTDEELGRLYGGQWMLIPWSAVDANYDIMIAPSVATEMTVEFMVFS